jgi:2-keto-3-deoxy-L-rhamnonate aldolase RhmA
MNAIKDTIKSGRTVVGTTAGPNVDVSILAEAGYDFVLFDTQHSPLGDQAAATVDPDDARQAGGTAGARRREPSLSDLLRA